VGSRKRYKKTNNEELYNLNSSSNSIRAIRIQRRMRKANGGARMGKWELRIQFLLKNLHGQHQCEIRHRKVENI
jgi:hypothetical protein